MKPNAEHPWALTRVAPSLHPPRVVFTLFLTVLVLAGLPLSTMAQVACIPPPTNRVPGLPGPPDWLGTFNPPVKTGLDDPRWDGAGGFTWANGTSGDTARFQAISSSGKLFLSWFIQLPPNPSPQANVVYVGFTQAGGASPTNFAMTISLTSLSPQSDGANYAPSAFSVDNSGNPTALASVPSWIGNNTRVWVNQPANTFAVQTVIPISAAGINSGLNLGTDFNMWFEMQAALPPANPATVWDAIFPDGRGATPIATDVVTSGFNTVYPAPINWARFHQSSGPGDAACTLGGISITEAQIGTHNIDPNTHLPAPHEIQFTKTGINNLVNTFFASPTNGMTTNIAPGGITATFRIADWGSTYDPNAPWTTIPGGQDVPSTAVIPAGTTADTNNITFNWTVQDVPGNTWLSDFRSGSKTSDQCMLVELAGGNLKTWQASHLFNLNETIVDPAGNLQRVSAAGTSGALQPAFNGTSGGTTGDGTVTWTNSGPAIGPGLTFLNNSVLTNMDFVGASEFSRDAAINIQNLPPLSGANRDVYLFVQTTNMPSVVLTIWKDLFNKFFGAPADRNPQRTQEVLARMTVAQINEAVPSYRVFVFHDAGKKITIDGKDYFIVHPQSGFGYYVLPHADVNAWINTLQGASQIAPNLYRIAVPNNGIAHIKNTIQALEIPPVQKNCGSKSGAGAGVFLVGGILVVGIVVHRPRKGKSKE